MSKPIVCFFDSWGNLWETCSPEDERAEAFGPTGAAAPCPCGPTWAEAQAKGIIDMGEDGDFPVLTKI